MGYDAVTTEEVAVGKPTLASLGSKIKGNFDWLYSQVNANVGEGVLNGSFEADSDGNGTPDNWGIGLFPGGSFSLEATGGIYGDKHMKFTHPGGTGNGGGYLESDYTPWALVVGRTFSFAYYTTASVRVAVSIQWFNASKVYIGSSTIMSSLSHPSQWTLVTAENLILPTVNARYCKIVLECGYPEGTTGGLIYVDDVRLTLSTPQRQRIMLAENASIVTNGYSTGASWADVGSSFTINVPAWAKVLGIYAAVATESASGVPRIRFRVDSTPSTENTLTSPGSLGYVMSSEMWCDVGSLAGSRTLRFQAYEPSSGGRSFVDVQAAHNKTYRHLNISLDHARGIGTWQ